MHIGKPIKKLADNDTRLYKKQIRENYTYGIFADKDLKIDDYEEALEAVV